MRRLIWMMLAAGVSLVWITGADAQMKEGLWEISTQMEMKGMKGMPGNMPATTMRQCITKKDPVPQPERKEKGQECRMKDQKISGNTVTYAMECKGKDSVVLTSGKMTYQGNMFDGLSTTNYKGKGQPEMQMTNKMSGKYIGPCPK
jgi:hypothetical protein